MPVATEPGPRASNAPPPPLPPTATRFSRHCCSGAPTHARALGRPRHCSGASPPPPSHASGTQEASPYPHSNLDAYPQTPTMMLHARHRMLALLALLGAGAASSAATPRPTCGSAAEEVRVALAAGSSDSCAITEAEGRVLCWGESQKAVMVPPGAHAGQVSLFMSVGGYLDAYEEVCALLAGGGTTCWGNWGRTAFTSSLGSSVVSSVTFEQAASSGRVICAVADGQVQCGGVNVYVPSEMQSHQAAVVAAATFACALSVDGDVTCWALLNCTKERAGVSAHDNDLSGAAASGGFLGPPRTLHK